MTSAPPMQEALIAADDHPARASAQAEEILAEESTERLAFVHGRLELRHRIRALEDAYEQGFALDMAVAAEHLEGAAVELAARVQSLLVRKARVAAHLQMALYESGALREMIGDLFDACLRPAPPGPSNVWPHGLSPTQSYPWLRRALEHCAAQIDHALTLHDEPAHDTKETP